MHSKLEFYSLVDRGTLRVMCMPFSTESNSDGTDFTDNSGFVEHSLMTTCSGPIPELNDL